MTTKWYLSTWFISLMFALWFLGFPLIAGSWLLVKRHQENIKVYQEWENAGFGDVLKTKKRQEILEKEIQQQLHKKEALMYEVDGLEEVIEQKREHIIELDDEILYQSFGFYSPKYNLESSDLYKQKLDHIRKRQKEMVKNKVATSHNDYWQVNGNKRAGRKMNNDNIKMTLYAFNTDCDNAISKAKFNNIDSIKKRIQGSFDKLNKMNVQNEITIRHTYLDLKFEELYLAYEYEMKKQEEKEEQRRIKEEIREAEKVRKEIETMKLKIEKEETHFRNEINRLNKRLYDASDNEKADIQEKITELKAKLCLVEKDKENVFQREQNTRAGYVYIISNIGSFGENVYKIGVTRRLEPLDRVRELSGASVPFRFDIHAMIFSEDAPSLEYALHRAFHHKRVNKVNNRKEFFNVTLQEIQEIVTKNHNKVVQFTKLAEAQHYRESIMIKKQQLHPN